MNSAIRADPAARSDNGVGSNLRAFPHVHIFSNHRIRPDADAGRNARQRRDDSGGMDPRCNRGALQQPRRRLRKSNFRMRMSQYGLSRDGHAIRGNHAKRSRCGGTRHVFRGFDINQIVRPGPLGRGDAAEFYRAIAFHPSPDIFR
jgi:hypothetical protein